MMELWGEGPLQLELVLVSVEIPEQDSASPVPHERIQKMAIFDPRWFRSSPDTLIYCPDHYIGTDIPHLPNNVEDKT